MRVTDNMRQANIVRTLNDLTARQMDASTRATTGRQVNKPSDDPAAAAELARIRAGSAQVDAGLKAAGAARSDLELSESMLAQAGDLFSSARALAMEGANASLDADTSATLAHQVSQLKGQLVGIANARGASGYLFAGNKTTTTPFSSTGAFSGDDGDHVVDFGTGTPTAVNVSGARAFTTAGGRDVFADLDALQTALENNDQAAIAATFAGLESSRQQIVSVQADAGMRIERLGTTEDVLNQAKLAFASREETTAGANPYQAYSDLVTLGQSLEQAVGVAKKLLDLGGLIQP